jgi:hypothetical protein
MNYSSTQDYAHKDTEPDNGLFPKWLTEAYKATTLSRKTKDRIERYFEDKEVSAIDAACIKECLRKPEPETPELILPNDSQNIHACAEVLFKHLASTKVYFRQGKQLVKLRKEDSDDGERLEEVNPEAFRRYFGRVLRMQGNYTRRQRRLYTAEALLT